MRSSLILLAVCRACLWLRFRTWLGALVPGLFTCVATRLDCDTLDEFAKWWETSTNHSSALTRAQWYRPRHSREVLTAPVTLDEKIRSLTWRNRWAEWPTQFWPTFATEGSAYFTVDVTTGIESYAW